MNNYSYILVCIVGILILISGCLSNSAPHSYHIEIQNGTPLSNVTVCISLTSTSSNSNNCQITNKNGDVYFNLLVPLHGEINTYSTQIQDLSNGQIYINKSNFLLSINDPQNMTLIFSPIEPTQIPTQIPNLLSTYVNRVAPNLAQ